MKGRVLAALGGALLMALTPIAATAAPAKDDSRTVVFHTRFSGLLASASWTTCPQPKLGDVCTDTILLAFDSRTRDGKVRNKGPVVRTLTFVYRVVGGEIEFAPVAEWFGRIEGGTVTARPRLESARAKADVPVLICSVFEPEAGINCPESTPVDVTWTGTGALERIDEHGIRREPLRIENTWTRGWTRTAVASGTVGGGDLGVLLGADLTRADQAEIIVQHPAD